MNFKNLPDWILVIFILGLGMIIPSLFPISYFKIDTSVNLIDILSLLLTIFLAYLVYAVLEKNKEILIKEKELISGRVQEVYEFLHNFSLLNNDVDFQLVISNLKRLNRYITSIDKTLKLTHISVDDRYKNETLLLIRELKDLMTNTLRTSEINQYNAANIPLPINIVGEKVVFSELRLNAINSKFDELKDKLIEYQLIIFNS